MADWRPNSSKRVPIRMNDFSLIDAEFGNMRERFDAEMRKMEVDMDKFRSDALDRESSLFKNSSSHSSHKVQSSSMMRKTVNGKDVFDERSSFQSSSSSGDPKGEVIPGSGLGRHSNWLQGPKSPLIQDTEAGQKELKLRFDVSQYSPEEIMVKTVDNKLLVHAKHEEKGGGRNVFREYNREFLLPDGTDPETIRSSLSQDGILTVEAPLPQPALTHKK
ncbi:heat shock protein 26-like isoform X1 [Tigriopus californicus]|uniref:heat shock protein 26-like isoform X1 n=1 Tax=Tigriopus californicus TaxID=6832 RepID=UPI0027DA6FA9|nr:heat shock protein 26-like isoform X1 [Tigriopus californicus]